jgi:hypothetical protein
VSRWNRVFHFSFFSKFLFWPRNSCWKCLSPPPPSGLWDSILFGCKGGCAGFLNPLGSGGTCLFSCLTKEKVSVTNSLLTKRSFEWERCWH